jgi:hypothetical protein
MPTEHCPECEPGKSCGKYHVYVIELRPEAQRRLQNRSERGYVYVGSTGKSVEDRFDDNWATKEDGSFVYDTPSPRLIREHFLRFRPDLFYREINPLDDRDAAERRERRVADRLRNRGYRVRGPSRRPRGS